MLVVLVITPKTTSVWISLFCRSWLVLLELVG